MAGHSKWSTIKRKKGEKDNQRAKIFTKISREIIVCIKETGISDPSANSKLRDLIAKAKSNNIPNENIERLLKKASGDGEKNNFESCVYEGYGAGGVAVIVECLTDNRNRTAGEIRHYFDKYGGNLGTTGCVSYLFTEKGIVVLDNEEGDLNEEKVLEDVIDSGGDDCAFEEGCVEIITAPTEVGNVGEALRNKGYTVLSAQAEMIPSTYVQSADEDHIKKMTILLEMLEDNDDVQNVWHNWEE